MSDGKYKGRKWKAFVVTWIIELGITVAASFKMVLSADPSVIAAMTGFMIACFGAINVTLGFYFTANVAQKKVTGGEK